MSYVQCRSTCDFGSHPPPPPPRMNHVRFRDDKNTFATTPYSVCPGVLIVRDAAAFRRTCRRSSHRSRWPLDSAAARARAFSAATSLEPTCLGARRCTALAITAATFPVQRLALKPEIHICMRTHRRWIRTPSWRARSTQE